MAVRKLEGVMRGQEKEALREKAVEINRTLTKMEGVRGYKWVGSAGRRERSLYWDGKQN